MFFSDPLSLQHQERDRQQGERDVMMPAHPTADFVMIQPDFAVAELEQFFDPMPVVVGIDQVLHRFAGLGVAETGVRLRDGLERADHQQSFGSLLRVGLDFGVEYLDAERPLLAGADLGCCKVRLDGEVVLDGKCLRCWGREGEAALGLDALGEVLVAPRFHGLHGGGFEGGLNAG